MYTNKPDCNKAIERGTFSISSFVAPAAFSLNHKAVDKNRTLLIRRGAKIARPLGLHYNHYVSPSIRTQKKRRVGYFEFPNTP